MSERRREYTGTTEFEMRVKVVCKDGRILDSEIVEPEKYRVLMHSDGNLVLITYMTGTRNEN